MTGAIGRVTLVGILGFVIMLASATMGLAAMRGPSSSHSPAVRHSRRLDARPIRLPVAPPPRQRRLIRTRSPSLGTRRGFCVPGRPRGN